MIVIGIDPGLGGALATVNSRGGAFTIDDLPTVAMAGAGITKRKLDGYALGQLLRRRAPAGDEYIVLLEDVRVMPSKKSGAAANTSLMHSKGVIEGVLGVLRMPPMLVNSQTWKRKLGLINTDPNRSETDRKADALNLARRMYPTCASIARAKDHNRAEALLIAHYGLIEVSGELIHVERASALEPALPF